LRETAEEEERERGVGGEADGRRRREKK